MWLTDQSIITFYIQIHTKWSPIAAYTLHINYCYHGSLVTVMVTRSSMTPHAALLVRPSGTIHPVVDHHEYTCSDRCCLWKQTWSSLAMSLVCLGSAKVGLSYWAIKWIPVLTYTGLCWVLVNPVTYCFSQLLLMIKIDHWQRKYHD